MTKTVSLTVSERVEIGKILGPNKYGNIKLMNDALKTITETTPTPEEWLTFDLKITSGFTLTKDGVSTDKIEEFPSEQALLDFVKKQKDDGFAIVQHPQIQWLWNDHSPEQDKEVTLEQSVIDYILANVKEREDAKEITMADKALITLVPKLQ